MPNYNAPNPLYSLFPGDVGLAFNAESSSVGQASPQVALPSYAGFPENGRTIRWQTSYTTAPTSLQIPLQKEITDVDAQYSALSSGAQNSTTTTGDSLTVTGVRGNFIRAKVIAISGGSGVAVQILG
jgi:hypothetical protein